MTHGNNDFHKYHPKWTIGTHVHITENFVFLSIRMQFVWNEWTTCNSQQYVYIISVWRYDPAKLFLLYSMYIHIIFFRRTNLIIIIRHQRHCYGNDNKGKKRSEKKKKRKEKQFYARVCRVWENMASVFCYFFRHGWMERGRKNLLNYSGLIQTFSWFSFSGVFGDFHYSRQTNVSQRKWNICYVFGCDTQYYIESCVFIIIYVFFF